jgi:hypothetical protein
VRFDVHGDPHVAPSYVPAARKSLKLIAEVSGQERDVSESVPSDLDQEMIQERYPINRQ